MCYFWVLQEAKEQQHSIKFCCHLVWITSHTVLEAALPKTPNTHQCRHCCNPSEYLKQKGGPLM